eukprot:gene22178-29240_t
MAVQLMNALIIAMAACSLQLVSSCQTTCDNSTWHVLSMDSLDARLAAVANATLATQAEAGELRTSEYKGCTEHYSEYYTTYYTEVYSEYFSHIFSEHYGELCSSNNNHTEYCRQYTRIMQDGEYYTQYYAKYFSQYLSNYFSNHFSQYCSLTDSPSTASCAFPSTTSLFSYSSRAAQHMH